MYHKAAKTGSILGGFIPLKSFVFNPRAQFELYKNCGAFHLHPPTGGHHHIAPVALRQLHYVSRIARSILHYQIAPVAVITNLITG